MLKQSQALSWLKSYGLVKMERVTEELGEEGLDRMRDLVSLDLAEGIYYGDSYVFRYISMKGEK